MEIATWFGRIDSETGSVFSAEDEERMIDALLKRPLPASPSIQPDLRRLAVMHG